MLTLQKQEEIIQLIKQKFPLTGYFAIRRDRSRKGGGVVCCVINKICYNTKNCISNEIENGSIVNGSILGEEKKNRINDSTKKSSETKIDI